MRAAFGVTAEVILPNSDMPTRVASGCGGHRTPAQLGDGQLEDARDERGSADRVADLTKLEAGSPST